ncbi:BolA family protein [Jiella sonneratiae]|uniref:BolA family transcriptional regulator n=1 Tax=Jiella sonneratiae TaxID=2816856 RepID=A0ABS3J866_9HYPH|nr:BolA family transcriptional regulator [Jiella sonneratiae]MBO0905320.1 BolA family transcriptional regulator [Jiella sonneratiae]
MTTKARIEAKLGEAFAPAGLDVIDESHMHAGHHHAGSDHHAAFDGSGETHFRIRIVADAFTGMSRIARHRAINALLAPELSGGVHALAIEAAAPGEPTRLKR